MAISLSHPLPGSTMSDRFGWRDAIPSIGLPAQLHNGQDFPAAGGTPIRAAHDGRVIWSGWDPIGGGWGVQLLHADGWSTLYFHMQARSTDVTIGQHVTAGQTIGRVGATGAATGNHLHFMLRSGGKDIDPMPYLQQASPSPSTPTTVGEIEEEMFIAVVNGNWYQVIPQGNSKPRAVILGADSNAAKSGLPIVHYTWEKSIAQLKSAVAGI